MSRRRKKKAADDLTRAEKRGAPGPTPLVLIAGLPVTTAQIVARTIINYDDLTWHAVATKFPPQDCAIYDDPAPILALGKAACGIAFEDQVDGNGVPKPSRIVVAYVDAPGSNAVWDVFGHAAWPVPLRYPDWEYPGGRHWRNDVAAAARVIRQALILIEAAEVERIRLRLEAHRSEDALMLPGRNFHLPSDERLFSRFRAFVAGDLAVDAIDDGITTDRFGFERLPRFYANVGGKNKTFAVDARNLVFARSNTGQHGGTHLPVHADAAAVQRSLESRYRFGTPFAHKGFQHDVQWEGSASLNKVPFDCATSGPVNVWGSHANIYPSDVVTAQKLEQIK